MPFSIVHTEIGSKIHGKSPFKGKEDYIDFIVGGILVDSNYLLEEKGYPITRRDTHYHPGESYMTADFSKNFFEKELLKDPRNFLKQGYYFHLIVDTIWRDSDFIKNAFINAEKENIYQIARKLHASYDIEEFLGEEKNMSLINSLYTYTFKMGSVPQVFKDVSEKDMQEVFIKMVDFMVGKDAFYKKTEVKKPYIFEGTKMIFTENGWKEKIEILFPYERYNLLKEESIERYFNNLATLKE